jgi:hypothetical protein
VQATLYITFPREVVLSLFPFFYCVFVLVFLGQFFEVFLGMYLLSFFFFLFSSFIFFFCYGSRVIPLGLAIWGRGFSFFLGPHMVECNGFFPSSLSLFPKEGGNIELGSCVAGGTLPSRA